MRRLLLAILALPSLSFATTVYIEEYSYPTPVTVYYQAASTPGVAKQTVAITASSVQSAAFSSVTRLIRVQADSICSIEIGTSPTATATSARLTAGQTEYFIVNPGDKLAVIVNN